jgi:hypothetical protein
MGLWLGVGMLSWEYDWNEDSQIFGELIMPLRSHCKSLLLE